MVLLVRDKKGSADRVRSTLSISIWQFSTSRSSIRSSGTCSNEFGCVTRHIEFSNRVQCCFMMGVEAHVVSASLWRNLFLPIRRILPGLSFPESTNRALVYRIPLYQLCTVLFVIRGRTRFEFAAVPSIVNQQVTCGHSVHRQATQASDMGLRGPAMR